MSKSGLDKGGEKWWCWLWGGLDSLVCRKGGWKRYWVWVKIWLDIHKNAQLPRPPTRKPYYWDVRIERECTFFASWCAILLRRSQWDRALYNVVIFLTFGVYCVDVSYWWSGPLSTVRFRCFLHNGHSVASANFLVFCECWIHVLTFVLYVDCASSKIVDVYYCLV